MRILLVGRGHLGTFLAKRFGINGDLWWKGDMRDLSVAQMTSLNPSLVVNAAGKTDLRWCEDNKDECWRCNVAEPLYLYRRKHDFSMTVPMIHLSSGCVWDGPYDSWGHPFYPESPPTPACFYAWTKASCDALMMQEKSDDLYILRPRQVYSESWSGRNTLIKMCSYDKLLDTPNSMTSAETIASTIHALADGAQPSRTYNVYDLGVTSPFRVGQLLAEAGLRKEPQRIDKAELDAWHKPKRVDAVLYDRAFEMLASPPDIEAELRRTINVLKGTKEGE